MKSLGHVYGDTEYLSVFSPNAEKYEPEKNSVFGQFSTGKICV